MTLPKARPMPLQDSGLTAKFLLTSPGMVMNSDVNNFD